MNFYPIYKNKKLLPWIKWWILKGNKIAPKHLSEWINSAEAITITGVYKGSPLLNLTLNGNTSQTGTPTPEAPVPVQVIKEVNYININDDTFKIDLGGTNLFNINATPSRVGGSTTYSLNNGILNVSGNWFIGYQVNVKPNTDYYISAEREIISGTSSGNISIYNSTITTVIKNGGRSNFTFNSGSNTVVSIVLYAGSGSAGEANFSNIMLNIGTNEKPYSPYVANPIELCKIGDYQDVIYKENNKWYVDKYIEKVVLNGSESFTTVGDYVGAGRFEIQNYLGKGGSAGNPNCLCNYYNGSFDTNNGSIFVSGVNSRISIINHSFRNNLEGFKTWLSENKPIVYYVLAESTTTEITETNLLSQLEAIYNARLQSGTNTITQTPSDLPFYLNFQYYEKG